MTGKESKRVRAAYNRHMAEGVKLATAGHFAAWDGWREAIDRYWDARYCPYPRYDEQMAALEAAEPLLEGGFAYPAAQQYRKWAEGKA